MTRPTFPDEFNIADYWLFDRLREGLADKVALCYGARSWTYHDVAERSRALARYLVDAGVAREQRVYSILYDSPPFAWTNFATLAAGAVVAMGNPVAPADDLAYVVGYSRAAAVVTVPSVAASLVDAFDASPELRTVLLVPETATGDDPEAAVDIPAALVGKSYEVLALTDAIERGRASRAELPATKRDDICIWLFTSGSTGRPKAAMHTHRDFAFNTEVYAKGTVGYRNDDITVSVPRLFFGYATGTNLWFPFSVGATVGLFSERPTPESLVKAIETYRPTVVTNVPTMLGKLLDYDQARTAAGEPGLDMSCVRFHLSAGEALPPALLERFTARFGCDVYDGIGSAEMFHIYCSNRPGDIKPGSLGRAVDGYELRVLPQEADGPGAEPVATGEIGVLWVKGDSVALGYFEDRDKSWRTFHGHWCCTGDLFRIDEDGYLYFSGRADDMFKTGGIWVAPLEVEECLIAHPAVSLAAVIPARDDDGLEKPKAFVVVAEGSRDRLSDAASLRAELQDHVKNQLSKHKYPRWVVFTDDLPKNDRGKVDKKTLKQREAAGENPSA